MTRAHEVLPFTLFPTPAGEQDLVKIMVVGFAGERFKIFFGLVNPGHALNPTATAQPEWIYRGIKAQ